MTISKTLRIRPILVLPLFGSLVAGCRDSDHPVSPDGTRVASSSFSDSDGETADLAFEPRFEIQLSAIGSLRPNEPIAVSVSVRANLSTRNAAIKLLLPDIEAARQSDWGPRFKVPVDVPIPIRELVRTDISQSQMVHQRAIVTVPVPGYYRVLVIASGESQEGQQAKNVQDVVLEDIWLLVRQAGGLVTEEFEETRFPVGINPQPGPFREGLSLEARRLLIQDSPRGLNTSDAGTTILRVSYTDDQGVNRRLAGAFVRADIYNVISGNPAGGFSGYTDTNGELDIGCSGYEYEYRNGRVEADNGMVFVTNNSSSRLASFSGDYVTCVHQDDIQSVGVSGTMSRVYENMNLAIPASRSFFSKSIGKIQVRVNQTSTTYDPAGDFIRISSNAVWGAAGVFSTAHEYGHAVHDQALGGLNPGFQTNCLVHFVTEPSSMGCALAEGFADYHAIATRGASAQWYQTIRDGVALFGRDGALIEGAVAALLFDLTDSTDDAQETHDDILLTGLYVADILRTCQTNFGRASGIDHVIYCLEKQIDPTITGNPTYFTARSADPTTYTEGAVEPSS
jgi:hypothetical protein